MGLDIPESAQAHSTLSVEANKQGPEQSLESHDRISLARRRAARSRNAQAFLSFIRL
jgi:hypothetical protein